MTESRNLSLDIATKPDDSERNVKQRPCPLQWRGLLQQAIVVFGMNLHSLSVGVALAFPTVVLSSVRGVNSSRAMKDERLQEHQDSIENEGPMLYDDDQASWYGSVSVTSVLLGSLVASAVQPRFGRRTVLLVANIFLVSAWSLSSVAQQPTLVLASTVLASLYAGSLVAPLLVYQSETILPHYLRKPILLSATHVSLLLGLTIEMALGAMLDWRTVAAVNTVFPGTCLLILLVIPESPAILEKRDQDSASAAVFSWMRGFPRTEEAEKRESVDVLSPPPSVTKKNPQLRSIVLLIASLCYHHLCGMTVVRTYSVPLLGMLSTKQLPSYVNEFPVILGCIQICGSVVGLAFRGWTGRSCRLPILLSAFLGSVGCSIALALYCHFFIHKFSQPYPGISIQSAIPFWLPTVLLAIFTFCSCMSIPLVPYSFAGEFFPSFAVGFPSRLALFLSCVCCFLCNKLFFLTIKFIGLRGLFWMYAITGSICSAVVCILLPRDLECSNDDSEKSRWQEMDDDLVDTWMENSSVSNSVQKSKVLTESLGDAEEVSIKSYAKDTYSEGREIKVAGRNFERQGPDWLGDISWAGRHGGWLVEETKRGGWRVMERGQRHEGGGGRSMDVEKGTWIGHMLQVVTTAATAEESKDFSKWKLANRSRKRWVIMKGPDNQWQICSAPWESDTSEESEDESDDVEESDSSTGSNYSEDQNSTSVMSDDSKSIGRSDGEMLNTNDEETNTKSHMGIDYRASNHQSSFGEYVSKSNIKQHLKEYKRSYSLGECNGLEK